MLLNPRPDPAPSAHDRVYRGLRSRIMHGELPPGQALTLRGIGAEFDVSMTPAREAVRRLSAEGALTVSRNWPPCAHCSRSNWPAAPCRARISP